MRKIWLLLGVLLLGAALTFAVACSDDDDDNGNGDGDPAATEVMDEEPTEVMDEEPTEADGEEPPGAATVIASEHPELGTILATSDGFTLYTFDNDEPGMSACNEGCVDLWPPMPAQGEPAGGDGVTGTLGTITRDDGTTQLTYDDQPLYFYSADAAAGDANGDGVAGVWHVVSLQ